MVLMYISLTYDFQEKRVKANVWVQATIQSRGYSLTDDNQRFLMS